MLLRKYNKVIIAIRISRLSILAISIIILVAQNIFAQAPYHVCEFSLSSGTFYNYLPFDVPFIIQGKCGTDVIWVKGYYKEVENDCGAKNANLDTSDICLNCANVIEMNDKGFRIYQGGRDITDNIKNGLNNDKVNDLIKQGDSIYCCDRVSAKQKYIDALKKAKEIQKSNQHCWIELGPWKRSIDYDSAKFALLAPPLRPNKTYLFSFLYCRKPQAFDQIQAEVAFNSIIRDVKIQRLLSSGKQLSQVSTMLQNKLTCIFDGSDVSHIDCNKTEDMITALITAHISPRYSERDYRIKKFQGNKVMRNNNNGTKEAYIPSDRDALDTLLFNGSSSLDALSEGLSQLTWKQSQQGKDYVEQAKLIIKIKTEIVRDTNSCHSIANGISSLDTRSRILSPEGLMYNLNNFWEEDVAKMETYIDTLDLSQQNAKHSIEFIQSIMESKDLLGIKGITKENLTHLLN